MDTRSAIVRRTDELVKGLAPDYHRVVATWIHVSRQLEPEIVKGADVAEFHHPGFRSFKVILGVHKRRRQIELVVRTRRNAPVQRNLIRGDVDRTLSPVDDIAAWKVTTESSGEQGRLGYCFQFQPGQALRLDENGKKVNAKGNTNAKCERVRRYEGQWFHDQLDALSPETLRRRPAISSSFPRACGKGGGGR